MYILKNNVFNILSSLQTLVNPLYAVSLPVVWILTLISGVLAFIVAGGTCRSLVRIFIKPAQTLSVTTEGTSAGFSQVAGL